MSAQLIQIYLANTPVHLDDAQAEGEPKLLWKVVLRTGTWKLRPGPGGVKLREPLKIFRDKAPKGHISMSELVKNFSGDDKGPAKEHVTIPMVHADGTISDGGFVKKLVIQDVKGEDGSKITESLLWAGMEITDSDLKKKLDEKSIRGVSGGILFDYERTEDAKKFPQVLSHVMVTNSPWIGGTGDFKDKLPEGVMASEPDDLPIGEMEFESRETERVPNLPNVQLDDPAPASPPAPSAPAGAVVWKPEEGYRYTQEKVSKALRDWRSMLMSSIPESQRYTLDWPYFSVSDVSLETEGGKALISSGYGAECDSWVASFKYDDEGEVELQPFATWTVAKQEWVAASEEQHPAPSPPPARPAGRARPVGSPPSAPASGLGLREAQAARAERCRLGISTHTTGGNMSRISDLLSRGDLQLSDEDREVLLAEERRLTGFEESETQRRERERQAEVVKFCGSPDGQTKGLLDDLGLSDPGIKKYVRSALLSDDGGPAIPFSVHLEDGTKTAPANKTATELLKGFIETLPKDDKGRVSLAEQARRLPDDPKPPEDNESQPEDPKANADALLADFAAKGLGSDLIVKEA
jgi:hypothetical protein